MFLSKLCYKIFAGISLLLVFTIGASSAQHRAADSLKSMRYIQNKYIRLGIDLNLGGAITYLADVSKQENLINNVDWGRQVQMSFYSGPVPFEPNGKKPAPYWRGLGWNPIQSGDVAGNRSRVIACKSTGNTLYVKCIPMHWPLDNVPGECTFEVWIKLEKNTAAVHCRLVNHRPDTTQYAARGQELPAVYTNAPYHNLVTYRGDKPFTLDTTSTILNHNFPQDPTIQWALPWLATENWAAHVNDDGYGLGVWNPDVQHFSGGFYGDSTFKGGSKSTSTGYISPVNIEILDHNITYDYHYTLILGTLQQIRDYAYRKHVSGRLPAYFFKNDRQHWVYENTTDKGWPIKNGLEVNLNSRAALTGPYTFWKAKEAPVLVIEAAYHSQATKARVYWRSFGEDFKNENGIDFTVIPDGKLHKYVINLSQSAAYKGALTGLKIVPDASGVSQPGDEVIVQSVVLKK